MKQNRSQRTSVCDVDVGVRWMGRTRRDGGEKRSGWERMKRLVGCKDRIRDKVTRRPPQPKPKVQAPIHLPVAVARGGGLIMIAVRSRCQSSIPHVYQPSAAPALSQRTNHPHH